MLEEWYCRSIANNNADAEDDDDDSPEEEVPNYKDQYRNLKRKLKFLIYVRVFSIFIYMLGINLFYNYLIYFDLFFQIYLIIISGK